MNETTKNFLNFDPIATAETLIGKRHEDWNIETDGLAALRLAVAANQAKANHLKSISDTHFGITWIEFVEFAKAYGFQISYYEKFTGRNEEEEEIIFFHEEKGLILHAVSYAGKYVNSAKVYGELKKSDKLTKNQQEALNGCSQSPINNNTMSFDVDVREGFRFHLDALSEAFEFSKNWSKVPFLWFLNYMDTKDENYNYEKITQHKIDACTPEVRKIIFG